MSARRMWAVVGGLFLMVTALIALFWLLGADFDSEYRRRALFTVPAAGETTRGTRLSACGMMRVLLPDATENRVPCALWNIASFYILPVVAMLFALKATLSSMAD